MTVREQCEKLYKDAFGESTEFDTMLFDMFFENIKFLQTDGAVAAMYFKIPCVLKFKNSEIKAYYIYAVTTHRDFRHRGLMSKLFAETQTESDAFYFLKPSSEGVIEFYKQAGFRQITGTRNPCEAKIEVSEGFKALSGLCDKPQCEYPLMIKGNADIEKLNFEYTLE